MEQSLLEKAGKSLDHWINIVAASGKIKHGEILQFLKEQHGFGHGFAKGRINQCSEIETFF